MLHYSKFEKKVSNCGAKEMAVIKEVNLIAHLEAWWRFRHRGLALPRGLIRFC